MQVSPWLSSSQISFSLSLAKAATFSPPPPPPSVFLVSVAAAAVGGDDAAAAGSDAILLNTDVPEGTSDDADGRGAESQKINR